MVAVPLAVSVAVVNSAAGEMEAELKVVPPVYRTVPAPTATEAWPWATVGASVVDLIQRECFDDLDAPVLKLNGIDAPMPYAKNLEHHMLPDPQQIAEAAKQVLYR